MVDDCWSTTAGLGRARRRRLETAGDRLAIVIVSDSARVLFVHVQKTGGLTVQDLLRQALPDATPVQGLGGGRHAGLGAALKVRPELRDFYIFGFVRNPWARMW